MYSVLLVDDEPITKLGLRKLISSESSEFELIGTASNGVEALRFVEAHDVDIVITDLKMPQMDGIELIHRLKEQGFAGAMLVLSNYSDFEMVREALLAGAVDYLLKVNITSDSLQTQLRTAASKLAKERKLRTDAAERDRMLEQTRELRRESLLKEFFFSAEPDISKELSALMEGWSDGIRLLNIEVWAKNRTNRKIPLQGITELTYSIFEQSAPVVLTMRANELLCLLHMSGGAGRLEDRVNQLIRQLAVYFDLGCAVYAPDTASDLTEAHAKYADCVRARELRFYGHNDGMVRPENVCFGALPEYFDREAALKRVEAVGMQPAALRQALDEWLQACAAAHTEPGKVRRFFYRVLEKLDANADGEKGPMIGNATLEAETAEQLKSRVLTLVPKLMEQMLPQEVGHYKREVKDVLIYIRYHLSDALSLEEIAGAVSLNPSYLCRVFKRETGESIFQYINRRRMARAARLMDEGQTYVKEIAAQVGIDDPFYFTRIFKKHYGVSPSEYQRRQVPE